MKLLIADDNEAIREMIKRLSLKYFNELVECSNGADAVAFYKQHCPDWVIMDIKMEKLDGLTSTRIIKQNDPYAKIIVVSQYKDSSFREEALNAGAVDFIGKENLMKIFDVINNHLTK